MKMAAMALIAVLGSMILLPMISSDSDAEYVDVAQYDHELGESVNGFRFPIFTPYYSGEIPGISLDVRMMGNLPYLILSGTFTEVGTFIILVEQTNGSFNRYTFNVSIKCTNLTSTAPSTVLMEGYFDITSTLAPGNTTNMNVEARFDAAGLEKITCDEDQNPIKMRFKALMPGTYTIDIASGDGNASDTVSVTVINMLKFSNTPENGTVTR